MQIYYFFIKRGNKKYIRRIYGYLRITNADIRMCRIANPTQLHIFMV